VGTIILTVPNSSKVGFWGCRGGTLIAPLNNRDNKIMVAGICNSNITQKNNITQELVSEKLGIIDKIGCNIKISIEGNRKHKGTKTQRRIKKMGKTHPF
jgi:hypothetical protein